MADALRGVYSAVATPFTAEQEVDETGLRSLVDRTIDAGIHGLVPCGSTGEFSTLTATERERVVEVVIEQAAGRVPVVPHTGACSTGRAASTTAWSAIVAGAGGVWPTCDFTSNTFARAVAGSDRSMMAVMASMRLIGCQPSGLTCMSNPLQQNPYSLGDPQSPFCGSGR